MSLTFGEENEYDNNTGCGLSVTRRWRCDARNQASGGRTANCTKHPLFDNCSGDTCHGLAEAVPLAETDLWTSQVLGDIADLPNETQPFPMCTCHNQGPGTVMRCNCKESRNVEPHFKFTNHDLPYPRTPGTVISSQNSEWGRLRQILLFGEFSEQSCKQRLLKGVTLRPLRPESRLRPTLSLETCRCWQDLHAGQHGHRHHRHDPTCCGRYLQPCSGGCVPHLHHHHVLHADLL